MVITSCNGYLAGVEAVAHIFSVGRYKSHPGVKFLPAKARQRNSCSAFAARWPRQCIGAYEVSRAVGYQNVLVIGPDSSYAAGGIPCKRKVLLYSRRSSRSKQAGYITAADQCQVVVDAIIGVLAGECRFQQVLYRRIIRRHFATY